MIYVPPYMNTGFIIAGISAVFLVIFVIIDRKRTVAVNTIDSVLSVLYLLSFAAAFMLIYVIPVIFAAISLIRQ